MRILMISAQKPDSTGSGVYLAETVRCLAGLGHEVAVICGVSVDDRPCVTGTAALYPVSFDTPELPFHVCGMSNTMPYPATRYCDMTETMTRQFEAAFTCTITRAVAEFKPDLVFCHHLYFVCALAVELLGAELPVVGLSHSTDIRQLEQHGWQKDRIIRAVRQLDSICALHAEQANSIARVYGVDFPGKIQIVGTGYNQQLYHAATSAEAPAEAQAADAANPATSHSGRQGRLVYVGKICNKKGVLSLIRALALIDPQVLDPSATSDNPGGAIGPDSPDGPGPADGSTGAAQAPARLRLDLIGGNGGAQDPEFTQIKQEAGCSPHQVVLRGRVSTEELVDAYHAADIFVLPSFYEGLPLVSIEALASGCKVVMTDLPGIRPWICQHLPQAPVVWVEPPRMQSVDEPLPEDLPAFERRLAEALLQALRMPPAVCDTTPLAWEHVSARIADVLQQACGRSPGPRP